MKSEEYKRGYDAGYKAALLDAVHAASGAKAPHARRLGGPDSPFKPRGVPGSIYNQPGEGEPFYAITAKDIIR